MNIKGIGTDIVSKKRIKEKIHLVNKFLNEDELEYFNSLNDEDAKVNFAAGRWAAKESIIKSYDKKVDTSMISVLNKKNGKPYVLLNKIEEPSINISISHEKEYAVAFSVVLKV